MLGKLIKYDIKSMNRFLIIIHAFLILISFVIRFFITGRLLTPEFDLNNMQSGLSFFLSLILYVFVVTGVYFATGIIIVVRFYKNLFSDQGYLTRTLPVTSGKHLLAKTISGSIWGCLDMALLIASACIVFVTPYVAEGIREAFPQMLAELGFEAVYGNISFGMAAAVLILLSILGVISNIIISYACVAIGQLVSGHRILGAVAAYFVINTVFSILSLIVLALTGLLEFPTGAPEAFVPAVHFVNSIKVSGCLCLGSAVILYIATYWIMGKKINLE